MGGGGGKRKKRKEGRKNTGLASVTFNHQNADRQRFNTKIARTRKASEIIV